VTAILLILCIAAFLWAWFLQNEVDDALSRLLPPEFAEGITRRFTPSVFALSPSTPLSVQKDYVNVLVAGSFAMLCLSLIVFSNGEVLGGWLMFGIFLVSVFSTFKAWKTYKENCNRPPASHEQEEE
jgi:hypothetical protein